MTANQKLDLHTNETWKAKCDESIRLVPTSEWDFRLGPPFLHLNEKVDGRLTERGWIEIGYDDSNWHRAVTRSMETKMSPMLDARRLTPRPIPALPEISRSFDNAVTCRGDANLEQWCNLLCSQTPIHLAQHTTALVEVESSVLTTGFLELKCVVGEGGVEGTPAKIRMLCAESYENEMDNGQPRSKENRSNFTSGKLYGPTDSYTCHPGPIINCYEPFWWRTFRYIRLEISTGTNPLTINSFTYRSTHYPLNIQTEISSTPYINQMWEISLNTVRNCMHETYEDCPFYEQNQFAMDSRSQILFTYLLSRDDRLARKTIHEFYASRRDDGLVETHFPNPGRSINIPQFSLYWILMIYDHMVYFADATLVKRYVGTVDDILNHFDSRVNGIGLVGRFDEESWPFIDWVAQWVHPGKGFKNMGIPKAYNECGAATFNSLAYAMVLQHAAELCEYIGRVSTANEYRRRAAAVNASVNSHCFDKDLGLYLDGPGAIGQHSQHVQVFAVLAGAICGKDAKRLMRMTILQSSEMNLARASFAMSFYVFRAVSLVDIYEEVWDSLLSPWRKMISDGLTTWAESESMVRSDCHGWSATPMYEIARELAGVGPATGRFGYGYKSLTVRPRVTLVSSMNATFIVGDDKTVKIAWDEQGVVKIKCSEATELNIVIRGASQTVKFVKGQEQNFQYNKE